MKADEFLDRKTAEEFLAAKRSTDDLLEELGASIADIATALQGGKDATGINATLSKMLAVLKERKSDAPISALTEAIKSLRAVNVQVSPTPITVAAPVVQVIERGVEYEGEFTYDHLDRVKTMRIWPVAPGSRPAPKMMFSRD